MTTTTDTRRTIRPYPLDNLWRKGWEVARVTGPHPQYVFDREFCRPCLVQGSMVRAGGHGSEVAICHPHLLWSQLTEQERTALPYLDASVREAARGLGLGKTTAGALLSRLKTLLADTAGDSHRSSSGIGGGADTARQSTVCIG